MIYEWRAYYIMPGRMPEIQKRAPTTTSRTVFVSGRPS